MTWNKEISVTRTIAARVDAYQNAKDKIERGYALLQEAQAELREAFVGGYGLDTLPNYRFCGTPAEALKYVLKEIRRGCWRALIDLSQIRKVMSVKAAEAIDKRLESGELDEITHTGVVGMLTMLMDQSGDFAKEAVKEVYDYLRPNPGPYSKPYKTNSGAARWRLGKKVILTWALRESYGSALMTVNHGDTENKLIAMDRVFHMLDGKGIPAGYRSPLVDAINTSDNGYGQTEYFKFRACLNRNLHLEFLRPDLVKKLNQVAGGGYVLHD